VRRPAHRRGIEIGSLFFAPIAADVKGVLGASRQEDIRASAGNFGS